MHHRLSLKQDQRFLPFNVRNPERMNSIESIAIKRIKLKRGFAMNTALLVHISILQIVLIVTMLIAFGKCTIDLFLKSRGRSPSEFIYKNMVPFAESQHNVIM